MTGEYSPPVLEELNARVARDVGRWGMPATTAIRLLNVSENATYGLAAPDGRELVLRVHRLNYSSLDEIRSELEWIAALRQGSIVDTAAPVAGIDGHWVQVLNPVAGGPARWAVAFEHLPGREPPAGEALRWFERLGEATARLHAHSRSWVPPPGFRRKRWDLEAMVGPRGYWGDWHQAIGLTKAGAAAIERALDVIAARLARLGQGSQVFGLVHADLRLANLLVDGERLRVIDFDDCGFSWFGYDFGTAVSFIEHDPAVPHLLRAWLTGYQRHAPLDPTVRLELPTFVALRRILLTAWVASHAEVPFAREMGADYTQGTVAIAAALSSGEFLRAAAG